MTDKNIAEQDTELFGSVMRTLVEKRVNLSRQQTSALVMAMLEQRLAPLHITALLAAMAMKGEVPDEIAGAIDAIATRHPSLAIEVPRSLNMGGTGGDRAGTFNISTTASLVVAAAGVPVVKHGNSRVTSASGSSDMITALGIDVARSSDEASIRLTLKTSNFAFISTSACYAFPETLTAARRALGIRSLFNLAAPLAHPVGVTHQLIGVAQASLLEPMADTLLRLGGVTAFVVHGAGGMDEVSCVGETQILSVSDGSIRRFSVLPEDFGVSPCELRALRGGSPENNARICEAVLNGEPGAYREATIVAAGTALVLAGQADSFSEAAALARQALDSGLACQVLKRFKETMYEIACKGLRNHTP